MSLHQNDKFFLVCDKHCLVSHWPPASEIGMLLVTTFVELCVVPGRSRRRTGSPQAVSRRPILIHSCHAVLCLGLETSLSERHGHGMESVNQTRPHSVNQMGKTHSEPLAARHATCELAFKSIICNRCECKIDRYGSHILARICCCEIYVLVCTC